MVSQLDAKIGEMMAALEETKQRDNTLVIFTSDNGGIESLKNAYAGKVGDSPLNSENDPLRGEKGTLYEGGTRVCAFVNWPLVLRPGKYRVPMHAVDWLPTVAAMIYRKPEGDPRWDGVNQWSGIKSGEPVAERSIYIAKKGERSLRRGEWKLIAGNKGKVQLFRIGEDPLEKREVSREHPEKVAELRGLMEAEVMKDNPVLPADLEGMPE